MNKVAECLDDFFEFMNWDKTNLQENDTFIFYKKRIYDEKEISKLMSYSYEKIFDSLYDTFYIVFRNEKLLQTSKAIEKDFIKEDLLEYIEEAIKFYDYVDVELSIDKKKYYFNYSRLGDAIINFEFFPFIYSANFISWIEKFDFKKLEEDIFKINKQTIFLINDCEDSIYNSRILIADSNIDINIIEKFKRGFNPERDKEIAKWRYEHVNWLNGTEWLNPDCFYFDFMEKDINIQIKNYFFKNIVNMTIPYISNYVTYRAESSFVKINGQKDIRINIKELNSYEQLHVNYLFQLYQWAYTGENSDKLSIIRNIITILLCEDCGNDYYTSLLLKSGDIYKTSINNFDTYLKENVDRFFSARQKFLDLIEKKSNEISGQISDTVNNLNKTLVTFLGTIFTSIISVMQEVNQGLIKFLLISFIGYVIIYGFYYLSYAKIRVNHIKKYYKEDVEKVVDNLLKIDMSESEESKKYYDRIDDNVRIFNCYWALSVIINIVLVIIAVIFICKFERIVSVFNIPFE